MPITPTPDYDSDLHTGSQIDPKNPPAHCGFPMNVSEEYGGYRLDCRDWDYEIHTDEDGVLAEPPYITN